MTNYKITIEGKPATWKENGYDGGGGRHGILEVEGEEDRTLIIRGGDLHFLSFGEDFKLESLGRYKDFALMLTSQQIPLDMELMKEAQDWQWSEFECNDERFINAFVRMCRYCTRIQYVFDGYRFGIEITIPTTGMCVCFDSNRLVVFGSNHNSYIKPDLANLNSSDVRFTPVMTAVQDVIKRCFHMEESTS